MPYDDTYYKARLDAIEQIIIEERGGDRTERNNHSVLLRNGIVPEALQNRYDKAFKTHQQAWLRSGNKQGLSFSDLTRFNNWFVMHPEKVAGEEKIMTSREFPISIKGSEKDIKQTINRTLRNKKTEAPSGNRAVDLSFTASNITVYDHKTSRILAQSIHDSESLIRLLNRFPNFTDRLGMYARLTNYYTDIPVTVRMQFFKNDPENTPNFPGNKVLEFKNGNRVSDYLDQFGDRSKTPISRTIIVLKNGDEYFWTNKAEWEESGKKPIPIRYEKTERKVMTVEEKNRKSLRKRRIKSIAKRKLLALNKLQMDN